MTPFSNIFEICVCRDTAKITLMETVYFLSRTDLYVYLSIISILTIEANCKFLVPSLFISLIFDIFTTPFYLCNNYIINSCLTSS